MVKWLETEKEFQDILSQHTHESLALVHFILNVGHLLTISLQLRENVLLHSPEYMLCDFLIDFIDFIS